MYTIYLDGKLIYEPFSNSISRQLLKADLELETNTAGSLDIQFPADHAYANSVDLYRSTITIYKDGNWFWSGRCITNKQVDFLNQVTYTFEGVLAFLNDIIQPSAKYEDYTIAAFVYEMLNIYSERASSGRKIYSGDILIDDGQNDRYTEYETTLKCLNDLVEDNGGWFRIDELGGEYVLHYIPLNSTFNKSDQYINFGNNLLDFTRNYTMQNFASVIIPLGGECTIPGWEENPCTIRMVNDGKIYIANEDLVQEFGWVEKIVNSDIPNPSGLKNWAMAQEYPKLTGDLDLEIDVSAIDLHLVDSNIREFKIGDAVRIISPPHNLDAYYPIYKMSYDLLDPTQNKISIGHKTSTGLTSYAENK